MTSTPSRTTRTCPDCGVALDPDEQFCGNCGCYLDWTDRSPAEPPPAAGPETPAPAPAPPRPGPPPPPPPRSSAPPPPPPPAARAMVTPVDRTGAPQPRPQQPGPQQPRAGQAPSRPRRTTSVPPEPLEPGDLVCGSCGTGNKPTRKFCRRCGETLAEAEVAKVPLLRRVLRRRRKVTAAGARPRAAGGATVRARPRFPTRLAALVAVLALLGVGAYTLRSSLLGAVDTVRDRISGVERVVPDGATASSEQQGHGVDLVVDGTPNKYWAPAEPGPGRGEFVEVEFRRPVRLVYVLVTPGVSSSDQEAFQQQGRPAEVRVTMTREDGTKAVENVEIEDRRGPAKLSFGVSDVVTARFEVMRSYAGSAPGSRTAIAELEFFVRK